MATQIEAKGLSEDEVRSAIEGALNLKNIPLQERQEKLKALSIKVLSKFIREDREFATTLYKLIKEAHPDISNKT